MAADLEEKTNRYEELLAAALDAADIAAQEGTPLYEAGEECEEMARSYLDAGDAFDVV
jgi:hypothetical protein